MFIDVVRQDPPDIRPCRGVHCGAQIEWVRTTKNRRMPVTHPLRVVRETPVVGDSIVWITIDAAQSHFATCPDAPSFKDRR